MTIQTNDSVTREDIIARFNTRIKDWVGTHVNILASTPYTASHSVWNGTPGSQSRGSTAGANYRVTRTLNTTAGALASSSTSYGGATNSILTNNPVPDETMTPEHFSGDIGAGGNAGHVVQVMRDFLKTYSKIHRVAFSNSGNLSPTYIEGIAKGTTIPAVSSANMDADINSYMVSTGFKSGAPIDAAKFLTFIEQCRSIWYNRCINDGVLETFSFSYCHSSCHSNVTCYNSRGRR